MPRLEQRLVQKQILAPQQILHATLLQLNSINLEDRILEELENNPVLEQKESEIAPEESAKESKDDTLDISFDDNDYEPATVYNPAKEFLDLPLPDRQDFVEKLIKQLDLYDLSAEERSIAEEILWNLDNRGYLATELYLIADRFGKTAEEIEPILHFVQHLEPLGIAAKDLQDCLLIQLEEQSGSIAYRIIHDHFDDFTNKRYEALKKRLGVEPEDLTDAIDVITHLNPRPGEGKVLTREEIIVPDLIVREGESGWIVRTNDRNLPELGINPEYEEMLSNSKNLQPEDRKFLRDKTDSANWFIRAIQMRRQTMLKVMHAIIDRQPEFFSGNTKKLGPMKLQDIADEIEMDVSTISRSTRGKYVDTPFGLYELKLLFTDGTVKQDGELISTQQVKQALQDIIISENKQKPLNDEALVLALHNAGYNVARRTVAKYREQSNIPVARLRREL
jgi:RNA polymerase sigma-54 factor